MSGDYNIYTLPMWQFFMVNKTGDLSYLSPNGNLSKKLVPLWEKINDELFVSMGISNDMQDQFSALRRLNIAKIDALMYGGAYVTLYEIEEKRFKQFNQINSTAENDFYSTKIAIERTMGVFLDLKKISVYEYFKYVEVAKEQNGKNKE
jgi:hypothetical protein